jgi:hypothetical protein
MAVALLDPLVTKNSDWSPGSDGLRALAEAIRRHGSAKFVSNINTRMMVLRDGNVMMPVTINDAEVDNSYVCSLPTYARYAKDELGLIGNRAIEALTGKLLAGIEITLRLARLNKTVFVNNWLVSTNPYPMGWTPDLKSITGVLTSAFPDHFICFRSLNEWDNRSLCKGMELAGYRLAAFRQIYVVDQVEQTQAARSNTKIDHKLLRNSKYRAVGDNEIVEADYSRICFLYNRLYRDKYSNYNPAYTEDFISLCHRSGLIRFLGLRNPAGQLDAMLGVLSVPGTLPLPSILGHDVSIDQKAGLYRIVIALAFDLAIKEGWDMNLSSGAAKFKMNRGARPVIENIGIYDRHLSKSRQLATVMLASISNRIGRPLMRRFQV